MEKKIVRQTNATYKGYQFVTTIPSKIAKNLGTDRLYCWSTQDRILLYRSQNRHGTRKEVHVRKKRTRTYRGEDRYVYKVTIPIRAVREHNLKPGDVLVVSERPNFLSISWEKGRR